MTSPIKVQIVVRVSLRLCARTRSDSFSSISRLS
ncbi:unnamed protein product [Arabidopsis lyrata]|nr:unnamed protein product [Arabidopsis lyrata]